MTLSEKDIKRKKTEPEPEAEAKKQPDVSAGVVARVVDLAFNPTREKIREVTVIDRVQGRLFPLIDMVNLGMAYVLEIAIYRQDEEFYRTKFKPNVEPIAPNWLDELLFRTAQWQKSVAGKNLERAIDIALAETEAKAMEDTSQLDNEGIWDR